jgi:hypothetical protein
MQGEKVRGPFSKEEVMAEITDGRANAESLIWGRSLPVWNTVQKWRGEVDKTDILVKKEESLQMWHYAIDGTSKGPLSRSELVNEIKNLRNSSEILVWTKGMKAWSDLYQFHDLVDEIGFNRREHPRSPIEGAVILKSDKTCFMGNLKTISPGGFGANKIDLNLSIGQTVEVEIKSEKLSDVLNIKATVQYISEAGFFGFQFQNISQEAKSVILEYLRKANVPMRSSGDKPAAA